MDEQTAIGIIELAAWEHGFKKVLIFFDLRDHNVRWMRCGDEIVLHVDPYVLEMSEQLLGELFAALFDRMAGREPKKESKELREWVKSHRQPAPATI